MKYIIFLSSLLLLPISSQAQIHLEPYGSLGASYSSSSSRPLFMSYVLGSRIGYHFLPLAAAGIDLFWTHYSTGSNSTRSHHLEIHRGLTGDRGFSQAGKTVSLNYSQLSTPFQPFAIGAFVSVELPFIFNAYGTLFYTFGDKNQVQHQGGGIKGGVSYLSAFYVQVNLELQYAYYRCVEQARCSANFSVISALLSLSVPIPSYIFGFGSSSSEDREEEVTGVNEPHW
ncbi:MAG: hypothetical protein OXM55_04225 [Bdellovibrionales bacterium]|nr:hypothetical protein [Bdellovibrionales bacterium]